MSLLTIERQKEKRTGVIPVLIVVGILGAAYALVNFFVRNISSRLSAANPACKAFRRSSSRLPSNNSRP